MELKKQDVGLMVVTIMKGLNSIDELPDQVKHIYSKMIALLFNHFQYSIQDLKSIEEFTEEEKSFMDLPLLGVFLDPNSIQEGEFKDAILKAKARADQQKIQETNPEMN